MTAFTFFMLNLQGGDLAHGWPNLENNDGDFDQKFARPTFMTDLQVQEISTDAKADFFIKDAQNTELPNIFRLKSAEKLQQLGHHYTESVILAYTSIAKDPTEILYGSSDYYCGVEAAKILMGISRKQGIEAYLSSLEHCKNEYYEQEEIINILISLEDTPILSKILKNKHIHDDFKLKISKILTKDDPSLQEKSATADNKRDSIRAISNKSLDTKNESVVSLFLLLNLFIGNSIF